MIGLLSITKKPDISQTLVLFNVLLFSLFTLMMISRLKAEDEHLTIIGDWQIEDTRTFSRGIRLSGMDGQIDYFLTPLPPDRRKNALFYVTCIGSKFYVDVELQGNDIDFSSIKIQDFTVKMVNSERSLQFDLKKAIIENDMLKFPIYRSNINTIATYHEFDLILMYKKTILDTHFDLIKSQEAVNEFSRRCESSN